MWGRGTTSPSDGASSRVRASGVYDTLTSLPNRRLFEDRLTIALAQARRLGTQLALLYVDVDRLNRINDTLGHNIGDEVLRTIGRRLASCARASDTIARLGGDEFVLIASNLRHVEDTVRIAQLLQQKINEPLTTSRQELFITASIGIAVFPQDGGEVGSLLASADSATRACKRLGGDGWYLHNSGVNDRAVHRLAVETDLHGAVERSEFVVRYQPLLNVAQQKITGVEALVRWQHPTRGELPPVSFLEVAEETGLIIRMGEQVIQSACAQARAWLDEGWKNAAISVNLSPRQFEHPKMLEMIDHAVLDHRLPPSVLQIEITEGTALRDVQRSIQILGELRSRGVRVSIDDFGRVFVARISEGAASERAEDRPFVSDRDPARQQCGDRHRRHCDGPRSRARSDRRGSGRTEQMTFLRERDCDLCRDISSAADDGGRDHAAAAG